ncbi:hypothetical protein F4777DRAFT_520836 [Nemania sp. FL0916]|nr:hypothetical protein F4777DRAFT_520836 [Nemania sp. FL0916]
MLPVLPGTKAHIGPATLSFFFIAIVVVWYLLGRKRPPVEKKRKKGIFFSLSFFPPGITIFFKVTSTTYVDRRVQLSITSVVFNQYGERS